MRNSALTVSMTLETKCFSLSTETKPECVFLLLFNSITTRASSQDNWTKNKQASKRYSHWEKKRISIIFSFRQHDVVCGHSQGRPMHAAKQRKNKLQQLKVIMKSVGYSIQNPA